MFIANQSHFFLIENETGSIAQYQKILATSNQKIQDVIIDYCHQAIYVADSNGSLLRSNLSSNAIPIHTELLVKDHNVQLLASQFGRTVYLSKTLQSFHSDGFTIRAIDGSLTCKSAPAKQFKIRAMDMDEDYLYLLDTINSVVWRLDLNQADQICDLMMWKSIHDLEQQPHQLVLLHQSSHHCISIPDSSDNEPETTTAINKPLDVIDVCLNFCVHGQCSKTRLNAPFCSCDFNFTGHRCEINKCHNFCLHQGNCSTTSLGMPKCTCPEGFSGPRCQVQDLVKPDLLDYYQNGFLASSIVNFCFFFVLLGFCIAFFRYKKKLKETALPQVIKKGRTRVFSTSSSTKGKRQVHF